MKNRISDNINGIILYSNLWTLLNLLGETIKMYEEGQWRSFDFPEQTASQMISMIHCSVNAAQESGVTNRNAWTRCMHAAQCAINTICKTVSGHR